MVISETILSNMTFQERWKYLTRGANPTQLKKFVEYNKSNRQVYEHMETFAEEAYSKGVSKLSHWMLLNRVRWECEITIRDNDSPFKINNNYFAYYARLLIARKPKFSGMLTLKEFKV